MSYRSIRGCATASLIAFGLESLGWANVTLNPPVAASDGGGALSGLTFFVFGPVSYFLSMAWLHRYLDVLYDDDPLSEPTFLGLEPAPTVLLVPGGALYLAWRILRKARGTIRGVELMAWIAWAGSCLGMHLTVILAAALPAHRDGWSGAFLIVCVCYSAAVIALMWSQPRRRTAELDLTTG